MMDIAAAEEEINRWKVAAEQEAAAGRGVEQEFVAQVCYLLPIFVDLFAIFGECDQKKISVVRCPSNLRV